MTAHYYGNWKLLEPATDELKESILKCVQINTRMAADGCFNCFAVMTDGDQVIWWLTNIWDHNHNDWDNLIEKLKSDAAQSPAPETLLAIGEYVFEHLKKET